jgi:hypothetical protein
MGSTNNDTPGSVMISLPPRSSNFFHFTFLCT